MRVSLNNGWAVREAPLSWDASQAGRVLTQPANWYTNGTLPLDVRMPLIAAGVIRDPVLSDYSYESEWVEKRSWWFKKTFVPDASCLASAKELVIESLDIHADIFLNGALLGHHASAHFPFRREISEFLVAGENTLLVRLTTGLEYVNDADLAEIDFAVCTELQNGCPDRGDKRRAFLRKPTYVFGWDWCPRIATVAIAKDAYLEYHNTAAIRHVSMETRSIDGTSAALCAVCTIERMDILASADADISLTLQLDGQTAAAVTLSDVLLCSGINYVTLPIALENAQLWWPNGMGAQPLYTVSVSVRVGNSTAQYDFRYGVRTITLDTTRMDDTYRRFAFCVNGQTIFCKGADWIPADSLYARVTDEKYDTLIREARAANFNMLRIWGGGLYERDAFYDACDRYGILVWQDMMFGCATYPDHLQDFYQLVACELDYQTQRLGSRTCIALFCGNNENHTMLQSRWAACADAQLRPEKQYGLKISNVQAQVYVRKNCPWVPYWNGSPYGGTTPNAPEVGDVHHWHCMMNGDMAIRIEPREYDKVQARFVSEYGYPGPCARESIEKYFDGQPVICGEKVWNHHNNTFEKRTVNAGIRKHYTDRPLSMDEYLLYAGMTQSLMLGYSLEGLRFKSFCSGALFWMYNDCWGEVGWTIIDYYLCRKISFYGVKRAFAPLKLILRESAGQVVVMGCNDTAADVTFPLRYGFITFDGASDTAKTNPAVTLPAYTRRELLIFDKGSYDPLTGLWYAAPVYNEDDTLETLRPAILYAAEHRCLQTVKPQAEVTFTDCGADRLATIRASVYCHGVYLDTPLSVHCSDNYFDMLPGECRTIRIQDSAGKDFALQFVE